MYNALIELQECETRSEPDCHQRRHDYSCHVSSQLFVLVLTTEHQT